MVTIHDVGIGDPVPETLAPFVNSHQPDLDDQQGKADDDQEDPTEDRYSGEEEEENKREIAVKGGFQIAGEAVFFDHIEAENHLSEALAPLETIRHGQIDQTEHNSDRGKKKGQGPGDQKIDDPGHHTFQNTGFFRLGVSCHFLHPPEGSYSL